MKFSTAILAASLFAGALSVPVQKRAYTVTTTVEVIHVVTATSTHYIQPYHTAAKVEKPKQAEAKTTIDIAPIPTPEPVKEAPKEEAKKEEPKVWYG